MSILGSKPGGKCDVNCDSVGIAISSRVYRQYTETFWEVILSFIKWGVPLLKIDFRYLMTKDFQSSLRTNYKMNKLLFIFLDVSEISLNI